MMEINMKEKIFNRLPKSIAFRQFIKFSLVGIVNTLIDISVYFDLKHWTFYFTYHLSLAKTISFLTAVTFSFFTNRSFTFNRKSRVNWNEALRFYATVGSGVFLNVLIHFLTRTYLNFPDILALLTASFSTLFWNFLLARFWVFKNV